MFTEYEIDTMMEIREIQQATFELKKYFIKSEAPYLELNDHDFFSLVMMAPTIGIAKADGKVTLFEELALNKKARKLSKGGYFMKKDPVVYGMKFMIDKYEDWEDNFCEILNKAMHMTFDMKTLEITEVPLEAVTYEDYKRQVLKSPYILIRFIASFFLEHDEDIINKKRTIGQSEYRSMLKIGEKLGLNKLKVFQMFCKTFDVKGLQ
ncbi:MAG: hypothetical protein GY816_17900 [Cytophagales bacterium]|nr:hypothetical protein [Cytophagales bacterium]